MSSGQNRHPAANGQTVLVLDFGSQYTQLIARRIREQSVYSVVQPFDISIDRVRALAPQAIIFSGGPQSVYADAAPICSREIFDLGVPILGICYGMQLTAYLLDGKVEASAEREYGRAEIDVRANDSPLFAGTPAHQRVWASHGDNILREPPGFRTTASSANAPIAAFENIERRCYGIQFHPEVTHSEAGTSILRNFLFEIAHCTPTWNLGDYRKRKVEEIRATVGDKQVIAAVSGGVDSSVAALLVAEAIGDQLTAIFVDNGVLRKNEAIQVMSRLSEGLGMHIIAIDGRQRFYDKLAGVEDPEAKRKKIGNEFIAVFEEEAKRIAGAEFL
ncbi:MAG TPA: glutamine-hydrolyzing GMP synthase, partial [Thermoanaerobaculia bacterium]|nr:glutamine-hydrolyzing GMP synthase [Thermoanaerobaculia bacterium]